MPKFLLAASFFVILIASIGGGYAYLRANPAMPLETSEQKKISLYLPSSPLPSQEMAEYLRNTGELEQRNMMNLFKIRNDIKAGRWPSERELLSWVNATHIDLQRFERAVASKGCLPYEKVTRRASLQGDTQQFRYTRFFWGAELQTYKALLFLRRGDIEQGIELLLSLHKTLLRYEMDCRPSLLGLHTVAVALPVLLDGVLFALRHRAVGIEQIDRLVNVLFIWSTRPSSSFAMALRQEAHQAKEIFTIVKEVAKQMLAKASQEKGMNLPPELLEQILSSNHAFDFEATKRLLEQKYRCLISLTQKPLSEKTFRDCPIESYLKETQKADTWGKLLRRNIGGKLILSAMMTDYRSFLLRWHQSRCYAAAHLVLWQRSLSLQDKESIPKHFFYEPPHPLLEKEYPAELSGTCSIPAWVFRYHEGAHQIPKITLPKLPELMELPKKEKDPVEE